MRFPTSRPTRLQSNAGAIITFLASAVALAAAAAPTTNPSHQAARDLSKEKTLYTVGYAHLDTQWRWTYPQVIREFIPATLHRNFELFEKYPDYVFNFSGSRRYEMMKEYYPDDYEKLKKYIAAGRWFPCGSSVDEGDCNVPSAESLVRHVLYGNRYFEREFGVQSAEFMLPDCFG
jgi:alpha-mannosidase